MFRRLRLFLEGRKAFRRVIRAQEKIDRETMKTFKEAMEKMDAKKKKAEDKELSHDTYHYNDSESFAAVWIIYNLGTELEFAECGRCGYEQVKRNVNRKDLRFGGNYPNFCCECGAAMQDAILADDIDEKSNAVHVFVGETNTVEISTVLGSAYVEVPGE